MNRLELFERIFPFCEPDRLCLRFSSGTDEIFGWLYKQEQVDSALQAWRENRLSEISFETKNAKGENYTIISPTRAGVVPHRNGFVSFFVIDLDNHDDGADNLVYNMPLQKYFQAEPICFRSKSGKGIHQFYFLSTPISVKDFLKFSKSWGFNRTGRPEIFPKSEGLSQVWLPNEPNSNGGDSWIV